jgi:acyl-CoA thioesterase-1
MMPVNRFFKTLAACLTLTVMLGSMIARADTVHIVALGDSLTAGYRLPAEQAFPAQLERALRDKGHDVKIANAGVSGDTASAGLERLSWAVPTGTDAVILQLGANDALRGIQPEKTYEALTLIIAELKRRHIKVLIAGMKAPPNMGKDFVPVFNRIYSFLSEYHNVPLYPFFLEGVAAKPELNQADGIHPTAMGISIIVRQITPHVEDLIKLVQAGKS